MQAFIYGGSGSGKSAFAERLLQGLNAVGPKLYIATMWPAGAEAEARIARHRAMRADKGFETVEQYTNLAALAVPRGSAVLLECLGNLVANEMFAPNGAGAEGAEAAVWQGLENLRNTADNVFVVSNDVGGDGAGYAPETRAYQLLMGRLNARLATQSDLAAEMVCGIPLFLKGERLWPFFAR